jgi:hypothetical protein
VGDDPTAAAGLLNIRVWTEDGQFRARIRLTTDLARPHEGVTVVTSPDEVQRIVATWLGVLAPAHHEMARSSGQ